MEGVPNDINTKLEQVSEGVRPIMISIGTFETYGELKEKYPDLPNINNDLGLEEATDVNWEIHGKALKESGFLNAGEYTYVISKIDQTNKLSKGYGGCVGIVSSGVENGTDRCVSFMTHQNLGDMTPEEHNEFAVHLEQMFSEMKSRCEPNTIDVVVFGGEQTTRHAQEYTKGIKFLWAEIKKDIEVDPVIVGPKIHGVYDNAYFDNKERRLYLVRSDETTNNIIFKGDEIDEKSSYWKNS